MELIIEWAIGIAPWMAGAVVTINLVMGFIKKLVDSSNKLKPYWFWIALALSVIGSVVTIFATGNWTPDIGNNIVIMFAQFTTIFGTQLITDTVMFKKLKPWIVKLWPIVKSVLDMLSRKRK